MKADVPKETPCQRCHGTGKQTMSDVACETCQGSGKVSVEELPPDTNPYK